MGMFHFERIIYMFYFFNIFNIYIKKLLIKCIRQDKKLSLLDKIFIFLRLSTQVYLEQII
jgi:hypothetical protein